MDHQLEYKLIQAVDPSSRKVHIRERFAKLTLSSNKKNEKKTAETNDQELKDGVRRSLLEQFVVNDASDKNPLFKSSSPEAISDEDVEATELDIGIECSAAMERLHFSENVIEDILSQKISCLSIKSIDVANNVEPPNSSEANNLVVSVSSEGEEAITISSSISVHSSNKDMIPVVVSDILVTGDSADAHLPETLSNNNADRIEAFLRDVSQQLKEVTAANGDNISNISASNAMKLKAMQIAIADTEFTEQTLEGWGAEDSASHEGLNKSVNVSRCLAQADTVDTESIDQTPKQCDSEGSTLQTQLKSVRDSRRLAQNDTVNTDCIETSLREWGSKNSTPQKQVDENLRDSRRLAQNDTEWSTSPPNSSSATARESFEESLVVPETSSESELQDTGDVEESPSYNKNLMGSINISAKINIKIVLPQLSLEEGIIEDDKSDCSGSNANDSKEKRAESYVEASTSSVEDAGNSSGNIQRQAHENPAVQQVTDSICPIQAERMLTELYGNAWQTPKGIRTLQRISKSTAKTTKLPRKAPLTERKRNEIVTERIEESILDDFSAFRRNPATNLDSTHLMPRERILPRETQTEPRPQRRALRQKQTRAEVNAVSERWRNLVDEDSQEISGSDDTDINTNSDKSWSGREEAEASNTGRRLQNTRRNGRMAGDVPGRVRRKADNSKDQIVYLDLSKVEISKLDGTPDTTLANNDEQFKARLDNILLTCRNEPKAKVGETAELKKTKRKLFTVNFGEEEEGINGPEKQLTPKLNPRTYTYDDSIVLDDAGNIMENVVPNSFRIANKRVEALKGNYGPIFALTPPKATPTRKKRVEAADDSTPKSQQPKGAIGELCVTHNFKYSFLKSLDVCASHSLCHPEALVYRVNYRTKKEELANLLYDLYNSKLFDDKLTVPVVWNKKLLNTAGRCLNKKKMGLRSSIVELSEKVLTSADRLRCTLVHELCHAATWIFDGEGGHGNVWKAWARKANVVFPDLPKIGVCHQYEIEYKYTYKCTLCSAKSHAHSKSKKVEDIRCSYCHGAIEIFLNKKGKDGNIVATPVREPAGFAKFVKDNYKRCKQPNLTHADVMKVLSNEFAALKKLNAN